ncbi:MAG: MFS transporter [Polyangiaceae bacterium]
MRWPSISTCTCPASSRPRAPPRPRLASSSAPPASPPSWLAPPMGRIMDRRGRTAIARAGGLLHLIVCLLYGTVVTAGPWVTTVRIAHGVAEAMLFTSLFAYASDIVPASRRYEGIALFGVSTACSRSRSAVSSATCSSRAPEAPRSPDIATSSRPPPSSPAPRSSSRSPCASPIAAPPASPLAA